MLKIPYTIQAAASPSWPEQQLTAIFKGVAEGTRRSTRQGWPNTNRPSEDPTKQEPGWRGRAANRSGAGVRREGAAGGPGSKICAAGLC